MVGAVAVVATNTLQPAEVATTVVVETEGIVVVAVFLID